MNRAFATPYSYGALSIIAAAISGCLFYYSLYVIPAGDFGAFMSALAAMAFALSYVSAGYSIHMFSDLHRKS